MNEEKQAQVMKWFIENRPYPQSPEAAKEKAIEFIATVFFSE